MHAVAVAVIKEQTQSEADDTQLAAAGDRRAFERIYRSHIDRIYSLCVRMSGERGRAEELAQDVFVRAWEKLPQFRGESLFSTWLHRLAINVILNARKADGRTRARIQGDTEQEDVVGIPGARRAWHAERMDLESAIAALPPGARMVFVLHDVEGFTHEEIAERLGVTSGGCKAQLHRARLLLREALER
jgi:RNA polymerase sigma-70 factor (ECF subfamily)